MSGELTQLVSLAGRQAPRIFLLQPPRCWDHYRFELPGPDLLYLGAEFKLSSVANALLTEPSLLAELIFFFFFLAELILKEQTEPSPTFYTSECILSTLHFLSPTFYTPKNQPTPECVLSTPHFLEIMCAF